MNEPLNQGLIRTLEQAGLEFMQVPQDNYELKGLMNPVKKRDQKENAAYKKQVDEMIDMLNKDRAKLLEQGNDETGSSQGRRILRFLNTPRNMEAQGQIEKFNRVQQSGEMFTYDIETIGNAMERKDFSVSEIAIQGFTRDPYGNFNESEKRLTQLIAPDDKVAAHMKGILQRLKNDKYGFNSLQEWEKRSIVDLTRYSTVSRGQKAPMTIQMNTAGELEYLTHNTYADDLFDEKEQIKVSSITSNIDEFISHAQSGLHTLQDPNLSIKRQDALKQLNEFMMKNKDAPFLSYNGDHFDMPVLEAWAGKDGLEKPNTHLDVYRLFSSVYPDASELHVQAGRNLEQMPFVTGMNRLQEYRRTLGFRTNEAHSAVFDIGSHGLGGVFNDLQGLVAERLKGNQTEPKSGLNMYDTGFSWSDKDTVKNGDTLFAIGGAQAYKDGDSSFKAVYDEESGTYKPKTNEVMNDVINAKSFYRVDGLMDFSEGENQRLGLRLFNQEQNSYSYIIREGDEALDQISSFVQSRFYNWEGLSNQQRLEIEEQKLTDSTRRRYERMFSLERGGQGSTAGFAAAKRFYENASIIEQRLKGKSKHIQAEVEATGSSYEELVKNRMSHDEMMKALDGKFHTLWDPETKSFKLHEREQKEFFRMAGRLVDERPVYQEAIDIIDRELTSQTDKDLAWRSFHHQLQQNLEARNIKSSTEKVALPQYENQYLSFTDIKTDDTFSINMRDHETTQKSLSRYVYQKAISDREVNKAQKDSLYKERIDRLVKSLHSQSVISNEERVSYLDMNGSSASAHDVLTMMTSSMQANKESYNQHFNTEVERSSMSRNMAMQHVSEGEAALIARQAVESTKGISAMTFRPEQVTGQKISFSPEVEKTLRFLDEADHQFSRLVPKNREAIERVMETLVRNNQKNQYNFAVSINNQTGNAQINMFKHDNSSSVVEHLARGESHPKALSVDLPLINRNGVHVIGNRRLNARQIALYDQGELQMQSTSEMIAEQYEKDMYGVMQAMDEGDFETANNRARQSLNRSVQKLSGVQRGFTRNDAYEQNHNFSDVGKQGEVEFERAMIHDLYNGNKDIDFRLRDEDFRDGSFTKDGRLKNDISINDLKPEIVEQMGLQADRWFESKGLPLTFSGVKGDKASKFIASYVDVRDLIPYGHYINQRRDNSIQMQNKLLFDASTIQAVKRDSGAYLTFNDLVTTPMRLSWEDQERQQGRNTKSEMNMKVVYMNDQQVYDRIQHLANSGDKGVLSLLREENILDENNEIIPQRMPRVYENQAIMSRNIQENIKNKKVKRLADSNYTIDERFEKNLDQVVRPGDIIGTENVNGVEKKIRWEGKYNGRLIQQNGGLGIEWEEDTFKYIVGGEKVTNFNVSEKMLEAITGDNDVGMILNPNIKKHEDFGMTMEGKAKLLAENMQKRRADLDDLEGEMNRAEQAGTSQKNRQRYYNARKSYQTAKGEFDRIAGLATDVGIEWNDERRIFIQNQQPDIPFERFNEILDEAGVSRKTTLGYDTFISPLTASNVSKDNKVVDETGYEVIGFDNSYKKKDAKTGEWITDQRPIYGSKENGVKWGHREMNAMIDNGLSETYRYTFDTMMGQAGELQKDAYKRSKVTRLQETENMSEAIRSFVEPERYKAPVIGQHELAKKYLPETDMNMDTIKGTIFDEDHIRQILSGKEVPDEQMKHGYWLELPTMQNTDGSERQVTFQKTKKQRQGVNRVFIPFTNMEGADGDIHLRAVQKNIRDIYRRAQEVDESKGYADRDKAFGKLQESVDEYTKSLAYDLTSSKGQTGESTLKARMPQSASGLFKLIDPITASQMDGEHTFISEMDAKKMGVYEKLQQIEADRVAGKSVDDLMTMNVRYPTFHKNAMQLSKLHMDPTLKDGEILTTSWMGDLMEGDSDGDKDNIVVIDDENVQKEWRQAYDRKNRESAAAYEKLTGKGSTASRGFDDSYISQGAKSSTHYTPFESNAQEEIAAKMGKRAIGQASNLNLFMRQIGKEFYGDSPDQLQAIENAGQEIEQKIISSKHGVKIQKGEAPAQDLIQSIYKGDTATAGRLIDDYYTDGSGKQSINKDQLMTAMDAINGVKDQYDKGLYNQGMRFGTSYGLNVSDGVKQVSDIVHGTAENSQFSTGNSMLNIFQRAGGREPQKVTQDIEGNEHVRVDPYRALENRPKNERQGTKAEATGAFVQDITGGVSESTESKVTSFFEKVGESKGIKRGMIGAGIALAGLAGYNIVRTKNPLQPTDESLRGPVDERSSEPPIPMADRSAAESLPPHPGGAAQPSVQPAIPMPSAQSSTQTDVYIQASGSRQSKEQLGSMAQQGMNRSQVQGSSRMEISMKDNTQNLSPIWYRDKVQENV